MAVKLNVHLGAEPLGTLAFDQDTSHWSFTYADAWVESDTGYGLSPVLPREPDPAITADTHSQRVRKYFENLLPEGQALDDAARTHKVSKANSFGLLIALGRETAGALRLDLEGAEPAPAEPSRRALTSAEISERIRSRPQLPFTVWDQRVRLSIAGYQDKLAVLEEEGEWSLVDGPSLASTHLLKPEPVSEALAGLTTNELFCMQFAQAIGVPVAPTRLAFVPEPVLVIERFDRRRIASEQGVSVERIHCLDGCQALNLPASYKYERPYGDSDAVKDIRDGASLRMIFELLREHAAVPARAQLELLRWTITQVLIGNLDAHAKNLTFFYGPAGLALAPAYDLTCGVIYPDIEGNLAMAIGDEFNPRTVQSFDWTGFTLDCDLPGGLVARELTALSRLAMEHLQEVMERVRAAGGEMKTLEAIAQVVKDQAMRFGMSAAEVASQVKQERKAQRSKHKA